MLSFRDIRFRKLKVSKFQFSRFDDLYKNGNSSLFNIEGALRLFSSLITASNRCNKFSHFLLRNDIPRFLISNPKDFKGLLLPAVGASSGVPVRPKDALLGLDRVNLKARMTSTFFILKVVYKYSNSSNSILLLNKTPISLYERQTIRGKISINLTLAFEMALIEILPLIVYRSYREMGIFSARECKTYTARVSIDYLERKIGRRYPFKLYQI